MVRTDSLPALSNQTYSNNVPALGGNRPSVVIAHDYLTQRGGAERVVLAMLRVFPDARIVTSVYDPEATYAEFRDHHVEVSALQHFKPFTRDPRRALLVLAPIWTWFRIDADVVICSSTGWAHGARTTGAKIVYCHNPARWLYQPDDYLKGHGRTARALVNALRPALRSWDQRRASSALTYIANSTVVKRRIAATYGRDAPIIPPPSLLDPLGEQRPVPGLAPGFLLTIGRARGYKNTDVVVRAMPSLPDEHLVVLGSPTRAPAAAAAGRITFLNHLDDSQLRWLYSNAKMLIACSFEDFGLTPVEAYSFGTPVAALRAGGYLDTTVPGLTGEYIEAPSPEAVAATVRLMSGRSYDPEAIREHASKFDYSHFAVALRGAVSDALEAADDGGSPALPS